VEGIKKSEARTEGTGSPLGAKKSINVVVQRTIERNLLLGGKGRVWVCPID